MSRQPSPLVAQRHEGLRRIRELKAAHSVWGYRRLSAYLHFVERRPVTKNRIVRLRREPQRLLTPTRRLRAQRTPTGKKPRPTKPNAWWGIELTKVLLEGVGWMYLVVGLDWYTKAIVGP